MINRNGELSGRWHWGDPNLMRVLLEEEGVEFNAQEQVDLKRFGWYPDDEGMTPRRDGVQRNDE